MSGSAGILLVVGLLVAFSFTTQPSPGLRRVRTTLIGGGGLLLVLGFLLLVVPPLARQVQGMVAFAARGFDVQALPSSFTRQDKLITGVAKTALGLGLKKEWVDELEENLEVYKVDRHLNAVAKWIAEQFNKPARWLGSQVTGLLWLVLLPFTLFYCLRDFDPLRQRLYYLVPRDRRVEVAGVAGEVNRVLGGYLRGYSLLSLAVGVVQTTVLLILQPIFHFHYGLFMGLLAGVTYFVPFLGSLVATIVTALVVFFTGGHNVWHALITWGICQGVNSVFDNFLQPRVIGEQTGLHPLVVMPAMMVGGQQFGILGVVLAAPVAGCAKILLAHFMPRLAEPIPDDQTPEAELAPLAPAEPEPEPEPETEPAPDGKEPTDDG
ncbi:MAG: AI-2E family transporter [Armatimonadetes bacterium]|nr:AI-2E family transporter [Armatimonadota bacterium]